MTLSRRDVENIAHLARLEITEAELPVYVGSLSAILAFVEQLSGAATGDVEPMAHPLEGQVDQGHVAHRAQRLGSKSGQGPQTSAETGRQHHPHETVHSTHPRAGGGRHRTTRA